MKYKIDISVDVGKSYRSVIWEEDFTRGDVKNFFSPSDNTLNTLIYPPEVESFLEDGEYLADDERAKLEEKIQRRTEDFEFDVIFPDSLRIWTEDLTAEYTRLTQDMTAGKLAGYEARYREIQSITDKEESVRRLYSLAEEMKS